MSIPIGQSGVVPGVGTQVPGTGPGAGPGGAGGAGLENGIQQKPAFLEQIQQNQAGLTNGANTPQNQPQVSQAGQNNAVSERQSLNRVNQASSAKSPDLFARFDQIRGEMDTFVHKSSEMDKMVAEGKLKPNDPRVLSAQRDEMRQMLFFQSEMQSAAMKVEIASKVVEHGTSGVKTVLQTQA